VTEDRVAGTPLPVRTVTVEGEGDAADWTLTMRRDFSARMLEDLRAADDVVAVLRAADQLVIDHNLPDVNGAIATSLLDVVPASACYGLVRKAMAEIAKVPNP
jgi:hypothetical protein